VRRSEAVRFLIRFALVFAIALNAPIGAETRAETFSSPQAIEEAFQRGLRVLSSGEPAAAVKIFRSILAEHPNLPRVRLELARAYFQAREWELSRREFFAVLSGDVPESVKSNIIRFLQAIDARRGFDWDLSVGFSVSPQATRKYDTDTVIVDVLGTPLPFKFDRSNDGAYGVRINGSAEYRHHLPALSDESVVVTGLAEGFFDIFEGDGSGADDYRFGVGLGLRGAWRRTTASGKVVVSTREFAGERFQNRFEFEGSTEWRSVTGVSLFSSGGAGFIDDKTTDNRDGRAVRLRAGLAKSLAGRSIVGVAIFGEDFDAEARHESYLTLGAELFGTTDLGAGFDGTGRVFLLDQNYDANLPLILETRKEREYGFDLELTKLDLFILDNFTPFVSFGYSRRKSSIDAFSYREYRFNIGLRKNL